MFLVQLIRILWARKWIAIATLASSIAVAFILTLVLPARYEGVSTVLLDVGLEGDVVTGQNMGGFAREYQRSLLALLQSDRVALDVVKRLNLTTRPDFIRAFNSATGGKGELARWIGEQLDKDLRVELPEINHVMTVTFRSSDPRFAAAVSNAFVHAFVDATLDMKVTPAQENADWYDAQLAGLRKELTDTQTELSVYQQKVGLIGPSTGQLDTESEKLHALADHLSKVRADLLTLESSINQLKIQWPDITTLPPSAQIPEMLQDSTLNKIKGDITETEAGIAKASGEVGPNHPRLIALRATLVDQRRQLLSALVAARAALLSRLDATRAELASTEDAFKAQQTTILAAQPARDEIVTLQKEVEVKQEALNSALAKSSTLRLQGRSSTVNATVIDEAAVPDNPVFPVMWKVMGMALGAGLGLGLALAFLAEMLDRRVRSATDLEFAANAKPLGTLLSQRRRLRWSRALSRIKASHLMARLTPSSASAPGGPVA
jgi:uncharacterized protein involved in exopolysaccharide biosynthesis